MERWVLSVDGNTDHNLPVKRAWVRYGVLVQIVSTLQEAINEFSRRQYSLVAVYADDLALLPELRLLCSEKRIPIVLLSNEGDAESREAGEAVGVDKYIISPAMTVEAICNNVDLVQQIFSVGYPPRYPSLFLRDIRLYIDEQKVLVAGNLVKLTHKDFLLLRILLENKDQVLSYERIYSYLSGEEALAENVKNAVQSQVKRVRKKVPDVAHYIKSVWGVGYKINTK